MQQNYPEPAVLNWDSVIHKGVRTKDGKPLGYIRQRTKNAFTFCLPSSGRYRIPKSQVREFDGSVVLLDLQFGKVGRYNNR